jgi:hypothetical protein
VRTIIVAVLTVRRTLRNKFRAFETHAAAVMKANGGSIERTIVVDPHGSADVFKEIHVLTFPSEQAFAAYRNDERLGQMAHLRDESVVSTEIMVGVDGPTYEGS